MTEPGMISWLDACNTFWILHNTVKLYFWNLNTKSWRNLI